LKWKEQTVTEDGRTFTFMGMGTPIRVFSQKRLQTVENKGKARRKEGKEATKRLQGSENMGFATEARRH